MKRFIDCYIPITVCNFKCHYCYIGQMENFKNQPPQFKYDNEYIAKAFSKKRLGGECLINLCAGGETLLVPRMVELIKFLLEDGHYVTVITNGSITRRFDEIVKFPKILLERLFLKFSFHYLELKRLNKIDEFFSNINKVKNAGISFSLEITPNDELIPYIDEIIQLSNERIGAMPHITIARKDYDPNISILSQYTKEKYNDIWKVFNSDLFRFKMELYHVKRKEFCYAGEWSIVLNLGTGEYKQCYAQSRLGNFFKDIDKPLNLLPVGHNCKLPYCFNGHSFLTLGNIPEINSMSYKNVRNRVCIDGSEWLTPKYKEFFNRKLKDYNKIYNEKEQKIIDRKNKYLFLKDKMYKISWNKIYNHFRRKKISNLKYKMDKKEN